MNRSVTNKRSKYCIYLYLIIISIQYGLINTKLELVGSASMLALCIELICFGIYLATNKYTRKTILLIALLVLVALVTYSKTGYTSFLIMIMTAIMLEDINYTSVFRTILYVRFTMFFIVIVLSMVGLLSVYKTGMVKSGMLVTGYGLGFTHPNRLAYVFQLLFLVFICYKNEEISGIDLMSAILFVLAGYAITKSRTLLITSFGLSMFLSLYKNKYIKVFLQKIIKKIALLAMPLCAVVSIGIPLLMLSATGTLQKTLYFINGLFSSRFTHVYRAFINYKVTLFGGTNDFGELQNIYDYSTVDNGYIRLLYGFGIVGFIIFLFLSMIAIKKLKDDQEYIYLLVCISVALWGLSENILTSLAFNICIIFWSELLKKRRLYDK